MKVEMILSEFDVFLSSDEWGKAFLLNQRRIQNIYCGKEYR